MALWFDYKYGSECGFTGDILGRVSRDNGETWLPETRLTYTQTGSSSTCLIVKDTLHAIWMDEDLFGCAYRKLMYSFSYDWGRTWSQAAIMYDSDDLYEHQPFLFRNSQEDGDMLHCIMLGESSNESDDLYYVRRTGLTQVSEHGSEAIPNELSIMAYPNPSNSNVTLTLNGSEGGDKTVGIYNIRGRLVKELRLENTGGNQSKAVWDATDNTGQRVASGIYFARILTPQTMQSFRVVYIR